MTSLTPPPFTRNFLDGAFVSGPWKRFFSDLYGMLYGGGFDKVDAAHRTALAAVPQSTQVLAGGGLQGAGGALSDNVGISFYRVKTAVAALPATGNAEGDWAYASNGRKPGEGAAAGTGVPVFWSHGAWIAVTSGAAVTA